MTTLYKHQKYYGTGIVDYGAGVSHRCCFCADCPLMVLLPVNDTGIAAEDGPVVWTPSSHAGELDEAPGSWLQLWPSEEMKIIDLSLSLPLSL